MRAVNTALATPPTATTPTRLPRWVAILVTVLGAGVAVAVGQLLAAFVGAGASPLIAVGDGVVTLTQAGLKEIAAKYLGTNDKPVLLLTISVMLLVLAALAGLASRRSATPGSIVITAVGVVGIIAVLAQSDLGQLAVLAPVGSIVAGVVVFRWLHRLALSWTDMREDDGDLDDGDSRRRFLFGSAATAAGALIVGLGGKALAGRNDAEASRDLVGPLKPATPLPALPAGADFAADGTPTFITDNSNFYRIDTALTVPQVSTQSWSLKIHGMVDKEVTFDYENIRRRKLVEKQITMTCVSNEVGGQYISTSNFLGVPVRDLLLEAGVHEDADELLSTSVDDWTAGTPVSALMDPNRGALLAIGMNGQPLPVEHGFPARMVVPGLYGYVSATKWVIDWELTTFDRAQGYWVPRGYSAMAPIKTESRIDKPGSFDRVPSGRVTVAGIAWAQTKGIDKVEVRVDGGAWQSAQLSTQVSKDTWRMWRTFVQLRPGNHTVEARATDSTGYTQTSALAGDIPDGATGYPSIVFTAT
jgi:DMSO/TMAO reductase YedYZ molybdopterin-dependent catalytic subunit